MKAYWVIGIVTAAGLRAKSSDCTVNVYVEHGLSAAPSGAAQPPAISVKLIDTYGAPKSATCAAQRDAARILAEAGVRLDWQPVPAPGGLTLYLLARRMVPAGTDPLGYAIIDAASNDRCNCAHLLYPAIERTARQWESQVSTVLGAAMAHEIGHLLLNSNAHSHSGIMRASFGYAEIVQASKGELLFTAEQAARIRAQVALLGARGTPSARDGHP